MAPRSGRRVAKLKLAAKPKREAKPKVEAKHKVETKPKVEAKPEVEATPKVEAQPVLPATSTPGSLHVRQAVSKPAKMGHLYLKRFPNLSSLTPGARRNRSNALHEVLADYAPTSRAACKMCAAPIQKNALRFTLMLQCHKGYKMPAVVHRNCFTAHPETAKIESRDEVLVAREVSDHEPDAQFVWEAVDCAIACTIPTRNIGSKPED